MMQERWAVAYEPFDAEPDKFRWLRDQGGDIVIFDSKLEAQRWVLTRCTINQIGNEIVFVKFAQKRSD